MFSARQAYAVTRTGSPSLAIASVAWVTVAAPAMSHFIVSMPWPVLMVEAAGVEGDALADERHVGDRRGGGVAELDEPGRRARAATDAEEAAAAEVGQLLLVEDRHA